jgi:malonyl-CoA/methylmalonyl-CoA synthetase
MHLTSLFDASLLGRADQPALEIDDRSGERHRLTFGALEERANRVAHALAERGVAKGDRVAVYMANRLEFIDVFLGCLRLGAIFVPINVLYREREIAHIITDAAPALIVSDTDEPTLFPPDVPLLSALELAEAATTSKADRRPATQIDGDDPAAIVYTSGTTGRSKGAVLSHNNFLANTANIVTAWQITALDRYLGVLPLFHVHGLANGLCAWLASGCVMRLVERFDHAKAQDWFETFEPTLFFGVPTIYVRLLELPAESANRIGRRARLFVSGSAPLPSHVFERFRERFGHAILERYGMSETLMLASNPNAGERRAGTVGAPLPGVSLRIVDESSRPVDVDTLGHVQVKGPTVFLGYWNNVAGTEAAFVDGWFRTGDLGRASSDGYLTLSGRSSDLIISGGFNIYPREIEETLVELPGVREVAVVGRPDPTRGEVPVAYLVAGDAFDEAHARAACAKALASFKSPRAYIRVDALPRNALGKVQKHLLPTI